MSRFIHILTVISLLCFGAVEASESPLPHHSSVVDMEITADLHAYASADDASDNCVDDCHVPAVWIGNWVIPVEYKRSPLTVEPALIVSTPARRIEQLFRPPRS